MSGTEILLQLVGGVALLLWGVRMVRTAVTRAFGADLRRLLGYGLANRFELDPQGHIRGFKLRIRGKKERIVSGFRSAGFSVAAMGDSMNDLSLLRESDYRLLYRPVDLLVREFPEADVAQNLDEALAYLERAKKRLDENG